MTRRITGRMTGRLLGLLPILLLAACATPRDSGQSLIMPRVDEGVLVVGLVADWPGAQQGGELEWLASREPRGVTGNRLLLRQRGTEDIQVRVLRSGRYRWSGVGIAGEAVADADGSFLVEAGRVTYVGHLELVSRCTGCGSLADWLAQLEPAARYSDRSAEVREHLAREHPTLAVMSFERFRGRLAFAAVAPAAQE
jgi:hypothetical protein